MNQRERDNQVTPERRRRSIRLALYLAAFAVSIYVAYILIFIRNQGAAGG